MTCRTIPLTGRSGRVANNAHHSENAGNRSAAASARLDGIIPAGVTYHGIHGPELGRLGGERSRTPMAYTLQAIIGPSRLLNSVDLRLASIVQLSRETSLIPFTSAFRERHGLDFLPLTDAGDSLPEGLLSICSAVSRGGSVAHVEAEYFGGAGSQGSIVCEDGHVKAGPFRGERAINEALRLLGVVAVPGMDEFDTLNLGRHRDIEDWTNQQTRTACIQAWDRQLKKGTCSGSRRGQRPACRNSPRGEWPSGVGRGSRAASPGGIRRRPRAGCRLSRRGSRSTGRPSGRPGGGCGPPWRRRRSPCGSPRPWRRRACP